MLFFLLRYSYITVLTSEKMAIRKKYVSIKRREIRRASKRAGSRRRGERQKKRDVGRRTRRDARRETHRPAISWEESLPPFCPPFSKLRDETGSRSWRETPANGTPSSLAVWNAVRRSFDNASGNESLEERREHLHSPREMRAHKSLSRVIARTVRYIWELQSRLAGISSRFLVLDFSSSLWPVINISLVWESRTL